MQNGQRGKHTGANQDGRARDKFFHGDCVGVNDSGVFFVTDVSA